MVINRYEVLICLILLPSIFSLVFLYSAISHISSLGKSRTKIKQDKRERNLLQKALLFGYVESCKYHFNTAKRLRNLYWLLIGVIIFSSAFSMFWRCEMAKFFLQYCVVGKVVCLDIPINIYSFIMTKHAKNGGVTWRWKC